MAQSVGILPNQVRCASPTDVGRARPLPEKLRYQPFCYGNGVIDLDAEISPRLRTDFVEEPADGCCVGSKEGSRWPADTVSLHPQPIRLGCGLHW
jgi:hypothetical protein